jgi:hypothetical protein
VRGVITYRCSIHAGQGCAQSGSIVLSASSRTQICIAESWALQDCCLVLVAVITMLSALHWGMLIGKELELQQELTYIYHPQVCEHCLA